MKKERHSAKKERVPGIKTEWNLGLLYASPKAPQIEKDVQKIEKNYIDFANTYKDSTSYTENEDALFASLQDWEAVSKNSMGWKPLMYFNYLSDLDAENKYAQSQLNLLQGRLTKAANDILFYELKLGKISAENQLKFLKNSKLAPYHRYLKVIFDTSKYNLSEPEEKIMSLQSQTSYTMWINATEKHHAQVMIPFGKKSIPLSEAVFIVPQLPKKQRYELSDSIMKTLKSTAFLDEAEINAIYTNKKIHDELRGFEKPYSSTILQYQNELPVVENLIGTVTKNFRVSHKFYRLKAQLMGEKTLRYPDRGADVGKTSKRISLQDAIMFIQKGFEPAGKKYVDIFNSYLKNGQIDFFPRKGKKGGAYCWGSGENPTFVLLNHNDSLDSILTLGHEMGHAIHGELSNSQPELYKNYTTSVAEVASTLFENFVFDEVFKTLSDREKIIALHDRLNDDIQTVFRQIACFNFELELHTLIRTKGGASKEEIAKLMNTHMAAYLGPLFKLAEDEGYYFASWGHIRRYFYVYSYAFGQLISKALYERYKKDPSYMSEIEKFLSAGSSMSPEDIFRNIGIDPSDPSFFEEGIRSIEKGIDSLQALIDQTSKRPARKLAVKSKSKKPKSKSRK